MWNLINDIHQRWTHSTNSFNSPFLAIDLIAEIPPKEVTERVVYCDGGDAHLGHPKVYINLVCIQS